jgi:hypothetical protein
VPHIIVDVSEHVHLYSPRFHTLQIKNTVLYHTAGTWLNGGLQEKYLKRLKVLWNSTLQIGIGKRRQECSNLELHSLANMLTTL